MKSLFARTAIAGLALAGISMSMVACSDDDDDPVGTVGTVVDTTDGTGVPGDTSDPLGDDTVVPETVPGDATTVAP